MCSGAIHDSGSRVQHLTGPGGSTESRYLHLFTLRNSKVVRGEFIGDTAKARDALGG
jgi:ketosteroid isomerase-like protein